MATTITWFNLPTKIKEEVALIIEDLDCLDTPAIQAALASITWFNTPTFFKALINEINEVVTTEYTGFSKPTWFKLEQEVDTYLTALRANSCAA